MSKPFDLAYIERICSEDTPLVELLTAFSKLMAGVAKTLAPLDANSTTVRRLHVIAAVLENALPIMLSRAKILHTCPECKGPDPLDDGNSGIPDDESGNYVMQLKVRSGCTDDSPIETLFYHRHRSLAHPFKFIHDTIAALAEDQAVKDHKHAGPLLAMAAMVYDVLCDAVQHQEEQFLACPMCTGKTPIAEAV
jgi:hypothetical protein